MNRDSDISLILYSLSLFSIANTQTGISVKQLGLSAL